MESTIKQFVLHLGAYVALYLSVIFSLVLLYGAIDAYFPNETFDYYGYSASTEQVHMGFAMLLVFYPTFLLLKRAALRQRKANVSEYFLTTWLRYLSVLIGGLTILITLVVTINTFLGGDVSWRFALKVIVLLAIVGSATTYVVLEIKDWWAEHKRLTHYAAWSSLLKVAVILAIGFYSVASPVTLREMRIDQSQVNDLMQIQSAIETRYYADQSLPVTQSQLEEKYPGFTFPTAPTTRRAYEYARTDTGFQLCAEFAYPSDNWQNTIMPYQDGFITAPYDWSYQAGWYCFEREVATTSPEVAN